ncbi:MAG: hypothetical protein V4582_03515 [Pseudomonadota bacterium]
MKTKNAFDQAFSEFVRPELLEAMKKPGFSLPLNEFRAEKVSFVLVAVHGDTPSDIGERLGVVTDIARDCHWFGDFLFSNLAVLIDRSGLPLMGTPLSRQELVSKLAAALGSTCKSIGGEDVMPCGEYGSARRRVFGAQIPQFLALVSRLEALPIGEHA